MPGNGIEVYRICREQAGLTQEQAAEGLNCSVRQLARYESGETPVPDDLAYAMVRRYDSQYLAVEHLRLVSHVAAEVLPPVTVLDLPRAAIRIINQVRRFADLHRERELLDIAEDGVISPEERPLFDEIMEELHELVRQHYLYTGSKLARQMLDDWGRYVEDFIQVVPIEYKRVLQEEQVKKLQQKIADMQRDY